MPHTFAIVIGPEVKKSAEGVTDFLTAFYESYVSELREIELVGWDKINELCSFICSYEDEQSDDICKLATTPIGKGPWPELSELMLLCAKEAQVYEYGFTCAKHAVSIISDALETNQLKEIFLTPESPDIVELDNGQERIQLHLTDDQHTLLC